MKILLISLAVCLLYGCGEHRNCKEKHICMPIVYRGNWDNKEAVTFSNPSGSIKASFKLEDLKKLEMWLYDGGLDYTEDINWDRLVNAVIQVESSGNPNAVSPKGAIGLMQITPIVLEEFNRESDKIGLLQLRYGKDEIDITKGSDYWIYNKTENWIPEKLRYKITAMYIPKPYLKIPKTNRIVGTWYLHRLKDHYKCETIEEILIAYNWGIGNLRKKGKEKAPKETKRYVKKVMKLYGQTKGR